MQNASLGAVIEDGDRVIPMSRLRKLVADHMVYSKRTSPHVGTVAEIDMSAVARLREANKSRFEALHGVSLSFLPFIVNAVVRALRETPSLNASVIEDAIVEKRAINIGIAVETEKGLMVPVVRDANRKSVEEIARQSARLSRRARRGELTSQEMTGGTFTITNLGAAGIDAFTPIVNPPQCAILGLGRIAQRPAVHEGRVVPRWLTVVSLTFDHRLVDGAPAARFLAPLRELVESPIDLGAE